MSFATRTTPHVGRRERGRSTRPMGVVPPAVDGGRALDIEGPNRRRARGVLYSELAVDSVSVEPASEVQRIGEGQGRRALPKGRGAMPRADPWYYQGTPCQRARARGAAREAE